MPLPHAIGKDGATCCSARSHPLSRTNVAWRRALWRAKTFGRGMQGHKPFFHVIEFWLENRLTIEVVSPAMAREYEDRVKGAQPSNDEATPALRRGPAGPAEYAPREGGRHPP
jgi:hypothetical protein